jgi:hypothetical protein
MRGSLWAGYKSKAPLSSQKAEGKGKRGNIEKRELNGRKIL